MTPGDAAIGTERVFLLLQLADAAFPAGGFAHSGGLEAARAAGALDGEGAAGRAAGRAVVQAGRLLGPVVHAVARAPARFAELDRHADTLVLGAVANRASRAQGRAYLDAACRAFATPALLACKAEARASALPLHHAPVLALVARELGAAADEVVPLFLHGTARGLLSAAVRLGLFGPFEAQRLQRDLAPTLAALAGRLARGEVADSAQIDPIQEIVSGLHDRLYSRLFQS